VSGINTDKACPFGTLNCIRTVVSTTNTYLFVVHLTTLSVSHAICLALNEWIILNNKLESILKEVAVV
jgi:hypothetical protein